MCTTCTELTDQSLLSIASCLACSALCNQAQAHRFVRGCQQSCFQRILAWGVIEVLNELSLIAIEPAAGHVAQTLEL